MKNVGLISIVLTLYNKAPYIEETIFSIYKQTYTNWELIIVDDCSTDWSFEIAKSFCEKLWIIDKCKFIQNEKNLRVAKTFERGLKEAKWDYISMQDGDDILMKDKLEKQFLVCEEKKIDFCFCWYIEIDENNNVIDNKISLLDCLSDKLFFKNPNYKFFLVVNGNAIWTWIFFSKKICRWLLKLWFPSWSYQDYFATVWNDLLGWSPLKMKESLFYYRRCWHCITYENSKSQIFALKKWTEMRYLTQKYVLSFIEDKDMSNWIKKLNYIEYLFIKQFDWKNKFYVLLKEILYSHLWIYYQWLLFYQAFKIKYLERKSIKWK